MALAMNMVLPECLLYQITDLQVGTDSVHVSDFKFS